MAFLRKKNRVLWLAGAESKSLAAVSTKSRAASSQDPAASKTSDIETNRWIGYIDRVDRSRIIGWCYDKANPDRSQTVEVLASNGKRIVAMASIFRQDVFDAGHKPGHFGFEVDVSVLQLKEETVIVRFADNGVAITKQPFSLDPQQALLSDDLPPAVVKAMETLAMEVRVIYADLKARGLLNGA